MARIVSFDGKEADLGCIGCAIESGEADFSRGLVIKTRHFEVAQDYETPIPGFFIVNARKHIASLSEFSEEEQMEFIRLVFKLRKGMRDALGIEKVCIFQNEDNNNHFHAWMLPKADWMEGRLEGKPLKSILDYAKQSLRSKENLKKVNEAVRKMRKYMEG